MEAIINRKMGFGTIGGVIKPNKEILAIVLKNIKSGTAKLLIDTDDTLMYRLEDNKPKLHPIMEQALKPFMP